MTHMRWMLLGLSFAFSLGAARPGSGVGQILGHPNPKSQVGTQGSRDNAINPVLNGKANRHRAKKVTNGTSTPPSSVDVAAGARLFSAQCATCHGDAGKGTLSAPRLKAPSDIWYTFHTQMRLEDYIQTHMPGNDPGHLTRTQSRQLAAYIWALSKAK